jgi:hypothetical protein
MKSRMLLLALLACALPAHAQLLPPVERGSYLSGQLGNGIISGGNARGDRNMDWLAFEARFGRDLNPALVGERSINGAATSRIDIVYYNEGHAENNKRDGFAAQYTYTHKLDDLLTGELSAGPYTSMNTTTINGVEIAQARIGILATVALRYPFELWGHGAHFRLAYNHVWMHDVHHSDALMFGVARHFGNAPPYPALGELEPLWLGAALGNSITNQSGTSGSLNAMLQAKQYRGTWAMSASAIHEGDDGKRVDRYGLAAQLWLVQPLTRLWTATAGVGPYLARNTRDHDKSDLLGLFTLQFERNLGDTKLFLSFNRVKTFDEKNDRDLFQVGLMKALTP